VRSTAPDVERTTIALPGTPVQTAAWQVSPPTPQLVPSSSAGPLGSHRPVAHEIAPDP
jgi:hypothetical protein